MHTNSAPVSCQAIVWSYPQSFITISSFLPPSLIYVVQRISSRKSYFFLSFAMFPSVQRRYSLPIPSLTPRLWHWSLFYLHATFPSMPRAQSTLLSVWTDAIHYVWRRLDWYRSSPSKTLWLIVPFININKLYVCYHSLHNIRVLVFIYLSRHTHFCRKRHYP